MCSVKFRGWHGPDSRATYEPIALFPDSSHCTCKKGHSARDIPYVNSSMDIPLSPPPSPSVTPSPTISPTATPSSSPEPITPSPVVKKRRSTKPFESPAPTPPSPPRTSSFGRTIKKSRLLSSPPSSPKHQRKHRVLLDLSSESIEISPEKVKKKSPRKALLFSHAELIPEPNTTTTTTTSTQSYTNLQELDEQLVAPLLLDPAPADNYSSLPLPSANSSTLNLPSFSQLTIPWNTPATSLPIVPAKPLPFPSSYPSSHHTAQHYPVPSVPTTPTPNITTSDSHTTLPPLSSIFNLNDPHHTITNNYAYNMPHIYQPQNPTQTYSTAPILLSPPKS